jgi:hypothetical protein
MGVVAQASPTPFQAVIDGAQVIAGDTGSGVEVAAATDVTAGAELAGLVWAYEIGAYGNTTPIANLANGIISNNDDNFTFFAGNEAYGLARTGQVGIAINEDYKTLNSGNNYTNATTLIADFYNTYIPANGGATVRANTVVSPTSDPTNPDTFGIYELSHHVLASNLVNATDAGTYRSTLQTALANLDTTVSNVNDPSTSTGTGATSTVQALGVALWALATTGTTGTEGIITGDEFGNKTLALLKLELIDAIDTATDTFFQRTSETGDAAVVGDTDTNVASGYAEDLAYGILALKALNDNTLTDIQRIESLEAALAAAVMPNDGAPLNVLDDVNSYAAQYTGAALQALPEPAALSLLAIGGLGLLARRRRQA